MKKIQKKAKASVKKLVKKVTKPIKKVVAKKKAVISEFGQVPSYAGTSAKYWQSSKFSGFRVRRCGEGMVRIHLAKSLEPNLRYRENYVALDVPIAVLKGLIGKL